MPMTRNRPELSGLAGAAGRLITLWHNRRREPTGTVQTYGSVIRWSRVRAPPAPRQSPFFKIKECVAIQLAHSIISRRCRRCGAPSGRLCRWRSRGDGRHRQLQRLTGNDPGRLSVVRMLHRRTVGHRVAGPVDALIHTQSLVTKEEVEREASDFFRQPRPEAQSAVVSWCLTARPATRASQVPASVTCKPSRVLCSSTVEVHQCGFAEIVVGQAEVAYLGGHHCRGARGQRGVPDGNPFVVVEISAPSGRR